jgi:hypothetical protein
MLTNKKVFLHQDRVFMQDSIKNQTVKKGVKQILTKARFYQYDDDDDDDNNHLSGSSLNFAV